MATIIRHSDDISARDHRRRNSVACGIPPRDRTVICCPSLLWRSERRSVGT